MFDREYHQRCCIFREKVNGLEVKLKEKVELQASHEEASVQYQQVVEDLSTKCNELQNAKHAIAQLDHNVRSQEQMIQKLKAKLREKVEKDKRRSQRDEDIYERIRQAHTSSRSNIATRAGAG